MVRKLEVFLHDKKVGILKDIDGKLNFKYIEEVNVPISIRLPIKEKAYNDKECRSFFENLLPEGDIRKLVANKERVSSNNPFSLLDKIGGDCAGAVSLYEEGQKDEMSECLDLKKIDEVDFYKIINEQEVSPLLTDEDIRLSLAGAQSKFALYKKDGDLFYPNDGCFSSHLIKPENNNFKDLVINEYFCMRLARSLGILVPDVELRRVKDKLCFIIDRYDRLISGAERKRVHQEDFCQIFGYTSDRKYQKSESGPSFKDCLSFIKDNLDIKSAERFVEVLIFNYLIGNCDAHSKNFSVLHHVASVDLDRYKSMGRMFSHSLKGSFTLAPFYDLISTDVYDVSKELAMKIGCSWDIREVQKLDLYKVAQENSIKDKEIGNLISRFSNIIGKANKVKEEIESSGFDISICDEIIKGIESRLKIIS